MFYNGNEKLVEKDVGFLEDAFEFLKHAVADEGHCLGNYMLSEDEEDLRDLEDARRLRTLVLDILAKNIKNQQWCNLKHLCGKAMALQELITRCLSIKDYKIAKKLSKEHRALYFKYLKILGIKENDFNVQTSA